MPAVLRVGAFVLVLVLGGCGDETLQSVKPEPPGPAAPAKPPEPGDLDIPAGKIVYERTGVPAGTITIWFQDHGGTVVYDEDTSHKDTKNKKRMIWRGGVTTIFDYETKQIVKARQRPVVIITSNNEKELPDAFLRRCFFHYIRFPDRDTMSAIVDAHYPDL